VPELPETETIARDLDEALRGARVSGAVVERPDVLRVVDGAELARRVTGATIRRAWRRAKLVVLDLDTGDRLVVQPRFTGALLVEAPGSPLPERERRFSTLHLTLDDGRALHYRDIRRLGTVALMDPARWAGYEGSLGTEPLEPVFTADHFSGILRASRQAVKKVLMDQRLVVGVGNIYANESLWRAGIDPSREARLCRRARREGRLRRAPGRLRARGAALPALRRAARRHARRRRPEHGLLRPLPALIPPCRPSAPALPPPVAASSRRSPRTTSSRR
jgi:formamidopyrimidine-DNA glycosylase